MQKAGTLMKALTVICMLLCLACAEAGPHRIPRRRERPKPLHTSLSWKQIAAGGAAAGTVIAAYKVSNGIENGFERAAERDPRGFLNLWAYLPHLLMLTGIFALYKWYQNLNRRKEEK